MQAFNQIKTHTGLCTYVFFLSTHRYIGIFNDIGPLSILYRLLLPRNIYRNPVFITVIL